MKASVQSAASLMSRTRERTIVSSLALRLQASQLHVTVCAAAGKGSRGATTPLKETSSSFRPAKMTSACVRIRVIDRPTSLFVSCAGALRGAAAFLTEETSRLSCCYGLCSCVRASSGMAWEAGEKLLLNVSVAFGV